MTPGLRHERFAIREMIAERDRLLVRQGRILGHNRHAMRAHRKLGGMVNRMSGRIVGAILVFRSHQEALRQLTAEAAEGVVS